MLDRNNYIIGAVLSTSTTILLVTANAPGIIIAAVAFIAGSTSAWSLPE